MNRFEMAFPCHGTMGEVVERGMTLRDYFAAKAVIALVTSKAYTSGMSEPTRETQYARQSYLIADAMLKEREK